MKIVLGLTEQGNNFSKIVIFIRRSRMNQLSELKERGQRLLLSTCTSQSLEQLTAVKMLSSLFKKSFARKLMLACTSMEHKRAFSRQLTVQVIVKCMYSTKAFVHVPLIHSVGSFLIAV